MGEIKINYAAFFFEPIGIILLSDGNNNNNNNTIIRLC